MTRVFGGGWKERWRGGGRGNVFGMRLKVLLDGVELLEFFFWGGVVMYVRALKIGIHRRRSTVYRLGLAVNDTLCCSRLNLRWLWCASHISFRQENELLWDEAPESEGYRVRVKESNTVLVHVTRVESGLMSH
jgi:hypothetical protein